MRFLFRKFNVSNELYDWMKYFNDLIEDLIYGEKNRLRYKAPNELHKQA